MADSKAEAKAALEKFYLAFDCVLKGQPDVMSEVWLHDDCVTSVHPFGTWARGWGEVWASWQELSTIFSCYRGHAASAERIGAVRDPFVAVSGDSAHSIAVLRLLLQLPHRELALSLHCSSMLQRSGGAWQLVHHQFDQAPAHFLESVRRLSKHGD
jgi:hypothetical protein